MLGAGEDQKRAGLFLQQLGEQAELAILFHFKHMEVDILGRPGDVADGHADGLRTWASIRWATDFSMVAEKTASGGWAEHS